MRITYGVSFGDFLSLQQPFTLRAGRNAGFKAAIFFCALIVALGIFLIAQGFGAITGSFIIGLGLLASVAAWFFETNSVASSRKKYEATVATAYQGIHCRDQRTFEIDESGFTTVCNCGTVTRPWTEFVQLADTKYLLLVRGKKGVEPIPKSAFPSEGDLTEFRGFLLGKLNDGRPLPVQHFEFAYKPADFRSAYWLHVWRGGGRRNFFFYLIKTWGVAVVTYFVLTNTKSVDVSETTARLLAIGCAIVFSAAPLLARPRRASSGPMRVRYDRENLHVELPASRIRYAWDQFVGYLENRDIYLLYVGPRAYKIIPKRALESRENEFGGLLRTNVRPYDYRNPLPGVPASLPRTAAENLK
jgi:hypothetical protein